MSPQETSRTTGRGRSRFTESLTPGRIGMAALAIITLVFIFQNTREVKIRLLIPEVTMPLYLALLATAILGAACGFYVAARRRK
ncbi:lipopolysaccharide assembly protein LapA domain-containing protein [Streptomyces sp. NPDC058326]|uniref:lipopolysaccharide assembly protein LapA domain-containing protein n=1 Tax=Streptomyces sp. NPDC058326 TaxID=3346447 RepID=UPI0036E1ED6E